MHFGSEICLWSTNSNSKISRKMRWAGWLKVKAVSGKLLLQENYGNTMLLWVLSGDWFRLMIALLKTTFFMKTNSSGSVFCTWKWMKSCWLVLEKVVSAQQSIQFLTSLFSFGQLFKPWKNVTMTSEWKCITLVSTNGLYARKSSSVARRSCTRIRMNFWCGCPSAYIFSSFGQLRRQKIIGSER